ncbi:SNF2 family N-terminal domain-containing protein [Apiospora rasikravindrae]|uniref:SNF2 family N-terminal domain-containing protein n=1 Tax=Apiospora rasikravindrae TaxID=990691 RepID=A0ABR1RSW7_9PEZI
MGRPRVQARSTGAKATTIVDYAQLNEPFPVALLDLLSSLPTSATDAADGDSLDLQAEEPPERPRKRARHSPSILPDAVLVAEETFRLSRPSRPQHLKAQPRLAFSRPGASQHVKLHCLFAKDDAGDAIPKELTISGQEGARRRIKSTLTLPPDVSQAVATILKVVSASRNEQDAEGGLLVDFDVDFQRGHTSGLDTISLRLRLNWNPTSNFYAGLRNSSQRTLSREVQTRFLPPDLLGDSNAGPLSAQAFYDAACIPSKDYTDLLSTDVLGLEAKLYPFQRRALQWLLHREGVVWNGTGLEPSQDPTTSELPLSFSELQDRTGRSYFSSTLCQVVTRDIAPFKQLETAPKGGILSEEMGLGKTVETIALILMHRRPGCPPKIVDPYSGQQVRPTGATLIVTPATLKNQWLSEVNKHAPSLRVMFYDGIKRYKGKGEELLKELAEHDVVITTYNVLQAEIHFAEEPPKRSMRHARTYPRPKSPLVQLSWWRVCLDEAQQIESGVSAAAKVARVIPRINAWGVTGTPVKDNVKDLWGLLLFLRYEPFASYPWAWDGLTTTHQHLFAPLFNRISLRHTKRAVRDELVLPHQKRYVLTMPFTAVEEQHYRSEFQAWARNCGLDIEGAPIKEDWDPEDPATLALLRSALASLRQTVLHPELGPGRIRGAAQRDKPLRTIEEVLDAMIEQSEQSIRTDQRQLMSSKLRRGQLLENSPRVKEALSIWEEVLGEIRVIVTECRDQLEAELESARAAGFDDEDEDESGSEESDAEKVPPRLGQARRRLQLALGLEHKAAFFIANANYQIKTNEELTVPESDDFKIYEKLEVQYYEVAKEIRKEMLQEAHDKAAKHMTKLSEDAATQSFVEMPEFQFIVHKGLESRRVLENLEELGGVLDEQANLIDDWREQVIQILVRPLVDEDGEAEITGEEYEDSTKIQDDLMVYTHVLRAVIADRQDILTGLFNERVKHETKVAERLAKDGEGPNPEMLLELLKSRMEIKPRPGMGSFRAVVTNLRELATKLRHDVTNGSQRAQVELEIVQEQLKLAQDQIGAQTKGANALEKELDRFTDAMNARVEYYKQLQQISDTVAPWERGENEDDDALFNGLLGEEAAMKHKIVDAQSKHRYLLHLKEAGQKSQGPRFCVICQSTFTLGVLTVCGHEFCKECMMLWYRAHHNCPVCKKVLNASMLHDISLRPESKLKIHHEHHPSAPDGNSPNKTRKPGIYSRFSEEKLQEIRQVDLSGPSFATKIDTLIRHLMWLRQEDPGAKSIIFSQFKGFLEVLGRAFDYHRIGYTSFDTKDGITRFKEDPGIECFFMDARAHASGLNLVNASHVFLCEPLLNTALELQAIARVDRIGQEHETTVWLYLVEGTVEESIYNLSVQRRIEHIGQAQTDRKGKSKEATPDVSDLNLEAANSMELQQAALSKLMSKDKQLGEVVDQNDLWECLFGHVVQKAEATSAAQDERFENPAVMRFLAGEAAQARGGSN